MSKTFIIVPPLCHSVKNRAECLSKRRERVFHARRDFGVNGSRDNPVRLHLAQAVGQHLLADAFKIFAKFVESPRAGTQVADNEQLPFAPDELYRGCHGASGQFFFCQHDHALLYVAFDFACYTHIIP